MASRYWVGGTGNWDASTTTNWSAFSGGVGGATVPSPTDNVIFDTASNAIAYTVTITASANCANLTMAGPLAGNVTWAGSSALNIYGNLDLAGGLLGNITRTFTGAINFFATSTGKTITMDTIVVASAVSFNGVGGGWTLQDNFNNGTSSVTLTAGALDTNGKAVTCGAFSISSSNARTLTLGASTINCSTSWGGTVSSLTFNANTSTIALTGNTAGAVFQGGGLTYNVVTITNTATATVNITGANTYASLTITGPTNKTQVVTFDSNQTVTTALTVAGNSLTNRLLISSSAVGTTRTFTCTNSPTLSNVDFQDITAAGAGGAWSGTSIGDCLGNTNITPATPVTRYGVVAGNWSDTATWSTSNGGGGGASVPLPQDTVYLTASSGAGTYTVDMPRLCATLDCNTISAFTRTLAFSATNAIFGAVVLSSGAMTISGTSVTTLAARSSVGITNNSKAFSQPLTIVAFGGTYTLQDTFTCGSQTLTLTNGTLDTNGQTVTCGTFNSNNSNVRSLTLGSSTLTLSGSWTILSTATFSGSSATLNFTGSSASFVGGGFTYGTVTFTGGGTGTISGNNTFSSLSFTAIANKTTTFSVSGGSTQTISGTLTLNGNSTTNRLLVSSGTVGTAAILSAGTIVTGNADFQDITAAGAANWDLTLQATNSSGDCGGNTGITFTTAVPTTYTMVNSDSWSTAARWSGGRVPLPQDNVTFGNCGTSKIVTADMPRLGKTVDMSGATFTTALTFTSSIANSVFGSYILVSGLTYTANSTAMTLAGRGSYSITGNTVTIDQPMTINAPSGTYSMGSNVTWGVTRTLTVTNGTLSTSASNYVISTGLLSVGSGGTLTLGTETDLLTGTGTIFQMSGTLNASTSTLKITDTTNTAITFTGGSKTFNNVYFSRGASTGQINVSGNNVFADFKDDGTGTHTISWTASTVNVFTTFTVSGTAGHLISLVSATAGTRFILIDIAGSNIRDYLSLTDCLVGGGATWTAGSNSTFVSNNEGWSDQPATPSRYWVAGNGNWSSVSNWATISGGASGASVPTGDMNVFFDANSGGGYGVVDAAGTAARNLVFTDFTGTLAGAVGTLVIHGSVTMSSGMTNVYSGTVTFAMSLSSKTITSAGIALNSGLVFGISTNSAYLIDMWTLADALSTTGTFSFNCGTLNAVSYNVTGQAFSSSNSNFRAVTMGSGTWTLTGTGVVWNMTSATNLTLTPGTSTIKITDSSTTQVTFGGGANTYNNIWFARGASTANNVLSGGSTFNDFRDTGSAAHSDQFGFGTTVTVTTFTVSGTAGNEISISSSSNSTSTHALVKTGGGTISADYLNIQHSVATPSSTWYAGAHSTNNQGVATVGSGWIFTAPPTPATARGGFFNFM